VHLDDQGVDDLAQARGGRGAGALELAEQRQGPAPARVRRRPARDERGGDRARDRGAPGRHPEPQLPHRLRARERGDHGISGRTRPPSGLPLLEARGSKVGTRDAACGRRRAGAGCRTEWRMGGMAQSGAEGAERGGSSRGKEGLPGEREREREEGCSRGRERSRNRGGAWGVARWL
jgi:hypothetical protein